MPIISKEDRSSSSKMEHLHDQSKIKHHCNYQVISDYATKTQNTYCKRHKQGSSSTTMGSDSYY